MERCRNLTTHTHTHTEADSHMHAGTELESQSHKLLLMLLLFFPPSPTCVSSLSALFASCNVGYAKHTSARARVPAPVCVCAAEKAAVVRDQTAYI